MEKTLKPWLHFAFYLGGKIDEHHKKNSKRGNKRSKDDAASPEVEQEVTSAIHDGIGENRLVLCLYFKHFVSNLRKKHFTT